MDQRRPRHHLPRLPARRGLRWSYGASGWRTRLRRHSLGWVCARDGGSLVGFVNVTWDGGVHSFVQDKVMARHCRSQGNCAALNTAAAQFYPSPPSLFSS
ncbi:hypothetical protein GCM10023084_64700 [Streptomyces lacrimifluminis]|uniref:Uncharacterized protein n=1 Tax=Streptomyces lacrimifluminis TaxID=1500077 RepID=A0A917P2Z2_9ACTN|nr:hypothetical protein GCM10012282_64650 [Streptomyces lacrimifluminis]